MLVAVLPRTGLAAVAELGAGEYAGGASKEEALWNGLEDCATEWRVSDVSPQREEHLCILGRLVGVDTLFACGCDTCGVSLLVACLFLDNVCFNEPKMLLRDSIVDVRPCEWKRTGSAMSVDISKSGDCACCIYEI
jgi:hypothetical protein